jgi:dinuclear metal center YbgI/SA1388 family protein
MPTVQEIVTALEEWAPAGSKLDFDRVGLQVGRPDQEVDRVLVALDLTPAVIDDAQSWGAELIITHHPLFYRPLERLVPTDLTGALVYRLAQAGISYYAIHTNLDAAIGGVSYALADRLGLADIEFLEHTAGTLVKLVTFVPESHLHPVREALGDAGAGRIGEYEACAFTSPGTGYFTPGDAARPFLGAAGRSEAAAETRIEVEVARWDLDAVLSALRGAHPYEEVAYDIFPLEQRHTRTGVGAVGTLPEMHHLQDFLSLVAERIDAPTLRYTGDPGAKVRRVAVCGGAGSTLIGSARRAGADAYVTADVTYHTFFQVLDPGGHPRMALIDAGHYETEWLMEPLLVGWLTQRFDGLEASRAREKTSPVRTFCRPA